MLWDEAYFRPVPSVLVSPVPFLDQLSTARSCVLAGAGQSSLTGAHPGLLQTGAVELQGLKDLHIQPLHLREKGRFICRVERQSKHEQEQANNQHGWT